MPKKLIYSIIFTLIFTILISLSSSSQSNSKLFSVCQRNAHCSGRIANSFCGWSELNDQQTVCMCRDGYRPTEDGTGCRPRHRCSFAGFNAAQQAGFECPDSTRQFCRKTVCLCRLGHDYDHLDRCVPNGDYSGLLLEIQQGSNGSNLSPPNNRPVVEVMEFEESTASLNLSFILYVGTVFLVVCFLLTIFSSVAAIVFFRKFHQLKLQMYSRMATVEQKQLLV